jgi:hypothetical protein
MAPSRCPRSPTPRDTVPPPIDKRMDQSPASSNESDPTWCRRNPATRAALAASRVAAREVCAAAAGMHAAAATASREAPAATAAARAVAAAARAATAAARAAAARGSASQRVRRVRQHPYIRPSRQRDARLRTPSNDEDEVVGPAKVEERGEDGHRRCCEEGRTGGGDQERRCNELIIWMVNIRAHANAPAKNERHVKKIRAHANAPAKKKRAPNATQRKHRAPAKKIEAYGRQDSNSGRTHREQRH